MPNNGVYGLKWGKKGRIEFCMLVSFQNLVGNKTPFNLPEGNSVFES